jgi:hypothetical protein
MPLTAASNQLIELERRMRELMEESAKLQKFIDEMRTTLAPPKEPDQRNIIAGAETQPPDVPLRN